MSDTTDEWAWLDEITTTYKERTDMGSIDLIDVPLNDDAKQSLKSHFEQMMKEREQAAVKKANQSGHFWKYGKQLDAYGNQAHYCNCGFAASNSEAIKGHVEWKIAELAALTKEEDK